MSIYKISILCNSTFAEITRKCENLETAMQYARMLAKLHYVEQYAARFIDNEKGESVAIWQPSKNAWQVIK